MGQACSSRTSSQNLEQIYADANAPPSGRTGVAAVRLAFVLLPGVIASAQCTSNWSTIDETGPAPRQNHALVFDSQRGKVILFGGYRGGFGFYSDTWEWDGAAWTEIQSPGPAARGNYAMCYDSVRNKTVIFGGAGDGGSYLGDTWEYDGAAQTWTQIFPASSPSPRYNAAMTFDPVRGVAVLFGGYSGLREGDTWTWNGANWTQVATTGCTPRNGHALTFDAGRGVAVLFGGFDGNRLGDTWEWNGAAWSQRSTFGGQIGACSSCREDDTWEWDGTAWTQLGDGQASIRDQHALVYHAGTQRLMLFGGYAGGGFVLDDGWYWRPNFLTGDLNADGAVG